MKKQWICLILIAAALAGLWSGCGNPSQEQTSEFYTIADFETLDELRDMNYLNSFGKASLNEDEQYVTSGEHSIRLEIHGNSAEGPIYYPMFWIYSTQPYNSLNKKDFTDVDYFTVDIYNASDRDLEMTFEYGYQITMSSSHPPQIPFTLKQGWNYLTIPFLREAAMQGFDIRQLDTFLFIFRNLKEGESVPVIYMDRFLAHKAEEPMGSYEKVRAEHEIFAFEELIDVKSMYVSGIYMHFYGNAILDQNYDLRYVREGIGSLKVVNRPFPKNPYADYNDSPSFGFRGDAVKDICDFSSYEAVKFSVFNASDRNWDWAFYVHDSQGAGYAKYGLTAKKGEWSEFVIPIADIATGTGTVAGETVSIDLTDITSISWAYNGFTEGTDLVFYLDAVEFVPKGGNV